jgi:predicted DNA-binding transcriptional regulator AlpA
MIQFEPLFTIDELSNELSINKYTLYKKIRDNKFPRGVKVNGQRYWKPEEIKNHYNQMGIEVQILKEEN